MTIQEQDDEKYTPKDEDDEIENDASTNDDLSTADNSQAPVQDVDPQSPASVDDQQTSPDQAAPVENNTPDQIASAPDQASSDQTPDQSQAPQTSALLQPVSTADELKQEHAKTVADLTNGHIKPETPQSLFAKKDTLGKIGTIFGLLVGGIGSGITGQPNAMLEMMNKQISNDLETQQQSAGNAQNLLKINQADMMNKSQIPINAANAKLIQADANNKAYNLTRMQMNSFALHNLTQQANKYPPGTPERQKADQAIGLLADQVQSENYNLADRAEAYSKMLNSFTNPNNGPTQPSPQIQSGNPQASNAPTSGVNLNEMNRRIAIGRIKPNTPGAIPPADVGAVRTAADQVNENRKLAAMYYDSFNRLHNAALNGALNPAMRQAEIEAVSSQIGRASGSQSAESTKNIAESMFPGVKPKDFLANSAEKFRKGMDHISSFEAGTNALDQYGLKTPFPKYTLDQPKKKSPQADTKNIANTSPQEGNKLMSKSGRPMTFTGGKWVYDSPNAPSNIAGTD
jgi:hypothetical protein